MTYIIIYLTWSMSQLRGRNKCGVFKPQKELVDVLHFLASPMFPTCCFHVSLKQYMENPHISWKCPFKMDLGPDGNSIAQSCLCFGRATLNVSDLNKFGRETLQYHDIDLTLWTCDRLFFSHDSDHCAVGNHLPLSSQEHSCREARKRH